MMTISKQLIEYSNSRNIDGMKGSLLRPSDKKVKFCKKDCDRRLIWTRSKQTKTENRAAQVPVLYVAFELANSPWKMACSDSGKLRHISVTAGDLAQVQRALIGDVFSFKISFGSG